MSVCLFELSETILARRPWGTTAPMGGRAPRARRTDVPGARGARGYRGYRVALERPPGGALGPCSGARWAEWSAVKNAGGGAALVGTPGGLRQVSCAGDSRRG